MESTAGSEAGAATIRRQVAWMVGVAAVLAAAWGAYRWGVDTGWGNPDRAVAARMERGEKAFVSGRMQDAADAYASVLDRYPDHPRASQAMTQLAAVDLQMGRKQEALEVLQKLEDRLASQAGTSDLQAYTLLQIGEVKKDLGDFGGALSAYAQVRTQHPKTDWAGEAQDGIGDVLQAQGKYPDARAAYTALIAEIPGGFLAAEAQTSIGQCFESEHKLKDALRAYEVVLKKYPEAVQDTAKSRVDALKKQLEAEDSGDGRS